MCLHITYLPCHTKESTEGISNNLFSNKITFLEQKPYTLKDEFKHT